MTAERAELSTPAPLRRIIARDGGAYTAAETLECGHLHRPRANPVYPERTLSAERRRCHTCAAELSARELSLDNL